MMPLISTFRSNTARPQCAARRLPLLILTLFFIGIVALSGCSDDTSSSPEPENATAPVPAEIPKAPREPLPEGIEWLTNDSDPVFASPEAKRGGILHEVLPSFPLTFRTVGPDSNTGLRDEILANQLSLVSLHPNTLNIIPELATHWAFGEDNKTMYFKLNPAACWSDGMPVTAEDFVFTLEFMRSEYIVSPYYNNYYTEEIDRIIVYDDHTLAVVATRPKPDLELYLNLYPIPRHYYGQLGEDFVQKYNWAIVPNTGPYQIEKFKKGRYVRFKRKDDWWANDLHYFKNRFNVDTVIYRVIRDTNMQWEYFKKARIDSFFVTFPSYWHIKTNTSVVNKGYVEKMWFFNDIPQSAAGFYLNEDQEIFKDRNLRYAFAHAINVEKVIRKVLRNDYFHLEQANVGYGEYTNPDIKARHYDIAKVEEYMRKAGWERGRDGIWAKDGRRYSVEVIYSSEEYTQRLVVFKEEAKKAGIELNLSLLDPMARVKKTLEKRHEVALGSFGVGLRPSYWQHWHSENAHKPQTNNITNTDNPELDDLIDRYDASFETEERISLSHQIQVKIHEQGSFVPTFMVPYFRQVYWRWWRFPNPAATKTSSSLFPPFDSMSGGLFWFDQDLYDETREAMDEGRSFPPVTIKDTTYKP